MDDNELIQTNTSVVIKRLPYGYSELNKKIYPVSHRNYANNGNLGNQNVGGGPYGDNNALKKQDFGKFMGTYNILNEVSSAQKEGHTRNYHMGMLFYI